MARDGASSQRGGMGRSQAKVLAIDTVLLSLGKAECIRLGHMSSAVEKYMISSPILLTIPIFPLLPVKMAEDEGCAEAAAGERSALTPIETRQLESRPCQSRRMSDVVETRALRTPVIGESKDCNVDGGGLEEGDAMLDVEVSGGGGGEIEDGAANANASSCSC